MLGSHLRQGLVTLNVSLGQMPLKAFRALFSARWTKSQISWAIAYAYTIYVALSAIPPFKGTSIFSVTAASGLLVLLYFFHSYANLNLKTASKFFIIAATISFIWEFIGVTTGIPFGQYSYTTSLSPSLLSVPLFVQLRDRLLLPVRPRQCDRRPSLGISLARPSLVHHLHHSNTDHLPSKRRPMEKAARNQRTY